MAPTINKLIGQLLLETGKIDENMLETALEKQSQDAGYLGEILKDLDVINESDLNKALGFQLKIPVLALSYFSVDNSVIELVPEKIVRKYKVFPIFKLNNTINLVVSDPMDADPMNAVQTLTGCSIDPVISTKKEIENAIDMHYGISSYLETDTFQSDQTDITDLFDESKIVELVNGILGQSNKYQSSDIHIEPREINIRVRFRLDGRLQDFQILPRDILPSLISRIKILANMDIAETRRPQDGRILFNSSEGRLDLRVSTYPTLYGEKIVLRLLKTTGKLLTLNDLGFDAINEEKFTRLLTGAEGIILVSGPTGSGKTTTLYSTLNIIERPDVNIVTIEDPIEYDMDNVNQAQVNRKSGVTFSSALRTILRQDPDIIMVGEIRDEETVELAIRAALTGHLVFSTIHTNDAASGFTRLLNWGVEPFLITTTVQGIMAQRLVRRICQDCKGPYEPSEAELIRLGLNPENPIECFAGKGCLSCRNTGYSGRIALIELLTMDDTISELVLSNAPGYVIRETAMQKGMITMMQDGLNKIRSGITTIQEVYETLGTVSRMSQ
jgi:type IV pilus assembly protein PilB